ncbi:hypothetical protein D5086_011036 [Populus alba]|uniref:Uncharacterized protein n=1 Tax=Populus alba TaxID=43335 RepID=A0ACC4CCH3_POPAL
MYLSSLSQPPNELTTAMTISPFLVGKLTPSSTWVEGTRTLVRKVQESQFTAPPLQRVLATENVRLMTGVQTKDNAEIEITFSGSNPFMS